MSTRGSATNLKAFARGAWEAIVLPGWMPGLSLLGIGSLAHDLGFSAGVAVLSTLLIWAGPGQALLFAGLASSAAPIAIAAGVAVSGARFLPMTVSALNLLRRPGGSLARDLLLAHYVSITTWAQAVRRLPDLPHEERTAYYLGFCNTTLLLSAVLTYLGYTLVQLPSAFSVLLLFSTPLFFLLSLVASARTAADAAAVVLGFALTPLLDRLIGREMGLLAAGLIAGSVAFLLDRRLRAR